jgi:hypothetical protein
VRQTMYLMRCQSTPVYPDSIEVTAVELETRKLTNSSHEKRSQIAADNAETTCVVLLSTTPQTLRTIINRWKRLEV